MRVVHLVSHVGTYGGERFVPALVRAQRGCGIDASVIVGCSRYRIPSLVRSLRALQPDIVHTHLAHAKHWGRLAAVLARSRHIVHTEHGNDFRSPLPLRLLTIAMHAQTDRVVAFTRAHAQRIAENERLSPEKIAIIPNGIERDVPRRSRDEARAALGVGPAQRMILAVGRLDAVKRYDRAVETLALLPREMGAELYVAGAGRLRDATARHAVACGVGDRVHLLGYRTDVATLLCAADLVLNSSESEAMPLSLIEALCSGVPIVSTPWPGVHELFNGRAAIAPDFTSKTLAATLGAALRAPRVRATPPDGLIESLSIERAASSYVALYEEVLGLEQARRASPIPGNAVPDGLRQ
jgi:glycosyltransferase involved in cell wall biosynthesis